MKRLVSILDFLFGCHHSHLSRVFTIHRRTYRVCCDCGAKFKYSLASMCIEQRFRAFVHPAPLAPSCQSFVSDGGGRILGFPIG
jgi:hypothetical protein